MQTKKTSATTWAGTNGAEAYTFEKQGSRISIRENGVLVVVHCKSITTAKAQADAFLAAGGSAKYHNMPPTERAKIRREVSVAQAERQRTRDHAGRYAEMTECDHCHKHFTSSSLFYHDETDTVICQSCLAKRGK